MKTQMKFQKILALVTLVFAALTFVYALSFMTELNPLRHYLAERNGGSVPLEYAAAFNGKPDTLYNLALKNTTILFALGLIFLLLSLTLYITASQKRRNYYITNYVSVIATAVMALVVAILGIVMVSGVMGSYSKTVKQDIYYEINNTYVLNFPDDAEYIEEAIAEGKFTIKSDDVSKISPEDYDNVAKAGDDYADCYRRLVNNYGNPTFTFVIGYVLYFAVLAVGVFNGLNLLWKIKLMQGEKKLLAQGKPEEKTEEVA